MTLPSSSTSASTAPTPDSPPPLSMPEPPAEKAGSAVWKNVLRVLLTAALLALLFWQVKWSEVWSATRRIDQALLFWAVVLWIPTQFLQFLKWALLARMAGSEVSNSDIHKGYWVGFTLGLITPGRIGEYGRALALHHVSLARAWGLSALERTYSGIVMNASGMATFMFLPYLGWELPIPQPGPIVRVIVTLVCLFMLLLGVFPHVLARPLRWIVRKLPLRDKLEKAVAVLEQVGPGFAAVLLLIATAALASSLLQFALLVQALGGNIAIFPAMLAAVLTFFLKGIMPISLGSLGVGEWSAMICFAGLGVEASIAVAASLLLFVINQFIPGLIGLPFVSHLRTPKWKRTPGAAA